MKRTALIALLFCAFLAGCSHLPQGINPEARKLNDAALGSLSLSGNKPDTAALENAINILNQAIKLDNNYFEAYYNKFLLQNRLKQYGDALLTAKQMMELRPANADIRISAGITSEKMGDTVTARNFYKSALQTYTHVLDTMSAKSKEHNALESNKAMSLILLRQPKMARAILEHLYAAESNPVYKQAYERMMNTTREDILNGGKEKTTN
jgi:tetratricopeptide (TPR) repeat protein